LKWQIEKSCQISDLGNIFDKYFDINKKGVFVDVGAYDGLTHSNTIGLAAMGWRGICIEPVPLFIIER